MSKFNKKENILDDVDIFTQVTSVLSYWLSIKETNKIAEFFQRKTFVEDKNLVLDVIGKLPKLYSYLPSNYQGDIDFVRELIINKQCYEMFTYVPAKVFLNKEFVFEMLNDKGAETIQYMPAFIREDKNYIKYALDNSKHIVQNHIFKKEMLFRSELGTFIKVNNDKDLCVACVRSQVNMFDYIDMELKDDDDVLSALFEKMSSENSMTILDFQVKKKPKFLIHLFSNFPDAFISTWQQIVNRKTETELQIFWNKFEKELMEKPQDYFISTFHNTENNVKKNIFFDFVLERLTEDNLKQLLEEEGSSISKESKYIQLEDRLFEIGKQRLKSKLDDLSKNASKIINRKYGKVKM